MRAELSPAGLDISILAEIVRVRRTAAELPASAAPPARPAGLPSLAAARDEARDPVCGMTVEAAGARHTAEVSGRTWYFCCGGCREKFLASPALYSAGVGT
jgi:YHS domain-containing protein